MFVSACSRFSFPLNSCAHRGRLPAGCHQELWPWETRKATKSARRVLREAAKGFWSRSTEKDTRKSTGKTLPSASAPIFGSEDLQLGRRRRRGARGRHRERVDAAQIGRCHGQVAPVELRYSYPYPCPEKFYKLHTVYTHVLLKYVLQTGLGVGMGMIGTARLYQQPTYCPCEPGGAALAAAPAWGNICMGIWLQFHRLQFQKTT